jgi:tight adherence protein C
MTQILLTAFIFAFTLMAWFLKSITREKSELSGRLKKVTTTQMDKKRQEEDELSKPFSERVVRPVLRSMSGLASRFTPTKNRQKLQQMLQFAGNPGNLKAHEYQALHFILIAVFLAGGWNIASFGKADFVSRTTLSLTAGLAAYLAGKAFLSSRTRKRNNFMQKELPDALDLLSVSVEAGLGFDSALHHVVEKSGGVLSQEFVITLNELKMGKTRREALRDLGRRTGVEDIITFVGAVIQADQLGVPITNILKIQAEQVRMKRRQRVEEQAMKAPVKMLFPLVFFIFPSVFIVLLGSAAIQIYNAFVGGKL